MPSAAVSSEVISEAIPGPHLILASSSPRRIDLIKNLGLKFEILPSDLDEIVDAGLAGRGLQRLEGPVLTVFLRDLRFILHWIGGGMNRDAMRVIRDQQQREECGGGKRRGSFAHGVLRHWPSGRRSRRGCGR